MSLAFPRTTTRLSLVLLLACIVPSSRAEPPRVNAPDSTATTEAEMKPYVDTISNSRVKFHMVPIAGGTFLMGSPEGEDGREEHDGPQHEVSVGPFWMGKHEVTWDEYEIFMFSMDIQRREVNDVQPTPREQLADAVTRPTKPYVDMTFDMGREGFPAICMTQYAAKTYCEWLSAKTGRYYRLPTEAEWEYACRAGTTTAYSFGDDPEQLDDHAWYYDNSENEDGDAGYRQVGGKKPNPWGLYDMHGNVAEWVLDGFDPEFYGKFAGEIADNPLCSPTRLYGRIARGGSWDDDPEMLRSAARRFSEPDWKQQDPQLPQSIWYHTDALFVGFRIVRPLTEPTAEEKKRYSPDPFQTGDGK